MKEEKIERKEKVTEKHRKEISHLEKEKNNVKKID